LRILRVYVLLLFLKCIVSGDALIICIPYFSGTTISAI